MQHSFIYLFYKPGVKSNFAKLIINSVIFIPTSSPSSGCIVTDVGECLGKVKLKGKEWGPNFFSRRSWSLMGDIDHRIFGMISRLEIVRAIKSTQETCNQGDEL